MAERFVQAHIRNLPLFAQLSPPQIAVISGIVQVLRFEPGQLVVQEGKPTQGLLLFVSGRGILTRRAPDGTEERVGTVEAGQYLDEAALHTTGVEPNSIRVVETAIVLLIPRAPFIQLLTQYPEIRANVRMQVSPDARATGVNLFKGQRSDETVLQVWRRHWWAVARHGWIVLGVAVGLFAFALLIAGSASVLALVVAGLAVIVPGLIAMYLYFEWKNDSYVLSDQRIVRIWNHLIGFESTLSEIPLDRVLEVNATIPPGDLFARLFRYGTVYVKTAGDAGNMTLDMIPNPMRVQSMIFTQRDRIRERLEQRKRDMVRSDIEQTLGVYKTAEQPKQSQPIVPIDRTATTGLPFARTRFVAANGDIYYRKHTTIWLGHIFLPSLMILVGFGMALVTLLFPTQLLSGVFGLALSAFVVLIGALWFYAADWDWRNDTFVISSEDITLTRRRPLWLQNEVERIRIGQIDNVQSVVEGLLDNILDRGDVRISLIGSDSKDAKVMDNIYDPQEVQAEISRRQGAIKANRQSGEIEQQRQIVKEYLQTYHELQQQPPTQSQAAPPTTPYARPAAADLQETDSQPPPQRDGIRPPRIPRSRPNQE
jgi:uncharacterized membrane protein YdbT with pleckstrin-like domain